uniref:Uncharacterized protein n=1 Tax=Branchiostoma floridae TaxID=7739 RepID=C3ZPN2_BRAFL|eukprot:XP_002589518.1 hypothetical protein BRAFLDRAFT_88389 [Branchiostoma floridae]
MATREITPSPEQVHTKGEDLNVLKLSLQREHEDNARDAHVSNISSGCQPSVPNENTCPAPTREKHTHQVKQMVSSSISEKDLKVRSKAANTRNPAYDHTVNEKLTGASPHGSASGSSTDEQPVAAGPRYLHIKDHVVVCSGHEPGHTYAYREDEDVSEGYEEEHCSHDYNKPEDVHYVFSLKPLNKKCGSDSVKKEELGSGMMGVHSPTGTGTLVSLTTTEAGSVVQRGVL